MAIDPSFFMDINSFKARMDDMIEQLRNSEKAEGQSRIFIHGEKEFEEHERRAKNGIPLDARTVESLMVFSEEFELNLQFLDS